jgi:hypothetical protein
MLAALMLGFFREAKGVSGKPIKPLSPDPEPIWLYADAYHGNRA